MRSFAVTLLVACALAPAGAAPRVAHSGADWSITNAALHVTISPASGRIAVLDRRTGYTWRQPIGSASPTWSNIRVLPDGVVMTGDYRQGDRQNTIDLTVRLHGDSGDLAIEATRADLQTPMPDFDFAVPLALDTAHGVLAVADYCDGHLYPLDENPFPRTWFSGDRLDMPWFGLCDLQKGFGCCAILETSNDSILHMDPRMVDTRKVYAPVVRWIASKGQIRYPRCLLLRFVPRGGYVALAQAYRDYAKAHGLVVPFTAKVKRNPNIRRLFGAVDVWGNATLQFANEAKSLGVNRMLIHGRSTPAEMRAINAIGYLTSEYDNYTDIMPTEPGKKPDSSHGSIPADVVMHSDGQRMKAWLTYDKKIQYMKRCPTRWVSAASLVVPKVLRSWPFLGRFVDVTTAEGLYECYDPAHPLNRSDKRHMGEQLLAYMRSQKLVVGGEHGIWWGVPHQDYIEGMMSGNRFGWPAGHLIHPKNRSEKFSGPYGTDTWDVYDRWSIGHEWRAPLWELVFHDCVVPTWYWGDSNDYLLDAAPEYTAKKDAFNILYGTMPMLWADSGGSWVRARDLFLRTCRNTSKVHAAIAEARMLSHEFVTPDHAVQRTRFSDGTTAIVNFGAEPRKVSLGGRTHLLPQNGFAVKGPRVEQYMEQRNGATVTEIHAPGYSYSESRGVGVSALAAGKQTINVTVTGVHGACRIAILPNDVNTAWDTASTMAYAIGPDGGREQALTIQRRGAELRIMIPQADSGRVALVLLCKQAVAGADLTVQSITVVPGTAGKSVATVRAANLGPAPVRGAILNLYVDRIAVGQRLASTSVSLAGREEYALQIPFSSRKLDGQRAIVATLSAPRGCREMCVKNNTSSSSARFVRTSSDWPSATRIAVEAGNFDRTDETLRWRIPTDDVAANSVRVVDAATGVYVPAQYVATGSEAGSVLFVSSTAIRSGASRELIVRWAPRAWSDRFSPRLGSMYNAATKTVRAHTYALRLNDGWVSDVSAIRNGTVTSPFINKIIYSSGATGWVDEPGHVTQSRVLEDGPVRTVIAIRKELAAGVSYEKTFTFEANRFTVATSVNKSGGVPSRAYYLRPGTFLDSGGMSARVDGSGEGEGVSDSTTSPKWYTVYSPEWSEVCIAQEPASRITYWDSTDWGGIGYVAWSSATQRYCYVIGAGSSDATFAARTWESVLSTPEVKTVH